jgi:phage shock protein E
MRNVSNLANGAESMTTKSRANAILFRWLLGSMAVLLVASGCSPADAPEVQPLSQEQLLSAPPAGALILDVRSEAEFGSGHVPGAINIPHDQLASRLPELDSETDRPVIVYCQSGKRAGMASTVLLEAGHTNVLHLEGDMQAWRANGLPTE